MMRRNPLVSGRTCGAGLLAGFVLASVILARGEGAPVPPPPSPVNAAQGRERDLGQGLVYFRIHQLPADLPPAERRRPPPCVVDLRYVRTNPAGAAAFGFWISGRATPRSPVLVLVNRQTDAALVASARTHATAGGVLLVGIAGDNFEPDITVLAAEEAEKSAYDAFEKGATIASLITDNPGKIRYDENSLGKDHRAESVAAAEAPVAAAEVPALPVDPVLQRAVHLHRALVAMKKL